MLGKLFGSNARIKILKLFLLHPEEKYYIRQISRDLSLQINSVRRELENLEQFGLLKSFSAKDSAVAEEYDTVKTRNSTTTRKKEKKLDAATGQEKKYFQVNKEFVLYEEIKDLIVKSQMLYERNFVKKIQELGNPQLFYLTGFFVNSDNSPVDLFIIGKLNKSKLAKIINDLEREMGRELNYTIMDQKEYLFRRDMTDVFLYNVLEGDKIVIVDNIGLA